MQHIVKTTKQGMIKQTGIICSGDNQTVRCILLNELKKSIKNPAYFTDIVVMGSISANCIKLIEEINAMSLLHQIENLSQFGTGLTHEFGDEAIHLYGVQGKS